MDESVGKLQPHLYQLHAVLGHVKDDEDETYYAFARPDPHAQWLHFDDDYVTPSMESRVFENAYGGVGRHCINATIRAHSAFMLVYIRKSAIDTILLPVADDEVPLALRV